MARDITAWTIIIGNFRYMSLQSIIHFRQVYQVVDYVDYGRTALQHFLRGTLESTHALNYTFTDILDKLANMDVELYVYDLSRVGPPRVAVSIRC